MEHPPLEIQVAKPVYPDIAREAGVDGTVLVQALICEHGNVVDVRVQNSIPMLDRAAVASVIQSHFQPATYHGQAVPAWVSVRVKFPPVESN